jgi:hypothetical protein
METKPIKKKVIILVSITDSICFAFNLKKILLNLIDYITAHLQVFIAIKKT